MVEISEIKKYTQSQLKQELHEIFDDMQQYGYSLIKYYTMGYLNGLLKNRLIDEDLKEFGLIFLKANWRE